MTKNAKLNIDQLLLNSLSRLIKDGKQPIFENLVAYCYEMFPQEFGLKGYITKYPDSSRVDKTWRRCRSDRRWIAGSVGHGFTITPDGNSELTHIQFIKNTPQPEDKNIQHGDKRTKSGRIVEYIEKHKAFLKFTKNKKNPDISNFDICDLLFSTLDAPPETRRKNLDEMRKLVSVYQRKDIINFLDWIQENKKKLL